VNKKKSENSTGGKNREEQTFNRTDSDKKNHVQGTGKKKETRGKRRNKGFIYRKRARNKKTRRGIRDNEGKRMQTGEVEINRNKNSLCTKKKFEGGREQQGIVMEVKIRGSQHICHISNKGTEEGEREKEKRAKARKDLEPISEQKDRGE